MGKIISLEDLERTSVPIRKLELFQLSTKWCGPCKMMRAWVEKEYDTEAIGYHFIDVEIDNGDYINSLVSQVQPKSVPTFVIVENENTISGMWKGASRERVKEYIELVNSLNHSSEEE